MKRFSDTDLDGESNNCYFMMNCLNLSFLFFFATGPEVNPSDAPC